MNGSQIIKRKNQIDNSSKGVLFTYTFYRIWHELTVRMIHSSTHKLKSTNAKQQCNLYIGIENQFQNMAAAKRENSTKIDANTSINTFNIGFFATKST